MFSVPSSKSCHTLPSGGSIPARQAGGQQQQARRPCLSPASLSAAAAAVAAASRLPPLPASLQRNRAKGGSPKEPLQKPARPSTSTHLVPPSFSSTEVHLVSRGEGEEAGLSVSQPAWGRMQDCCCCCCYCRLRFPPHCNQIIPIPCISNHCNQINPLFSFTLIAT